MEPICVTVKWHQEPRNRPNHGHMNITRKRHTTMSIHQVITPCPSEKLSFAVDGSLYRDTQQVNVQKRTEHRVHSSI